MSTASDSTPLRIGLITCSVRNPRIGPSITTFIRETIQSFEAPTSPPPQLEQNRTSSPATSTSASAPTPTSKVETQGPKTSLHTIDLRTWALPLYLPDADPSPSDIETNIDTNTDTDKANANEPPTPTPLIPAHITSPTQYSHPLLRSWSSEISHHSAFIFITPQYNWGYPAALKNAIDHLYHEWNGKPALIISYGGRGGGKAAEQLRQVLQGVRMRVCEETVGLKLDQTVMKGAERGQIEPGNIWGSEEVESVRAVWEKFVGMLTVGDVVE